MYFFSFFFTLTKGLIFKDSFHSYENNYLKTKPKLLKHRELFTNLYVI
ncbi:hypothetical protein BXY64_2971 [Marinifilum flexuosum]|uniref:Uncharacterized protein n=1 Tax=Marinifilum flexuosum TaxID=1117708 RepID=A0A419WX18_9BACT|nr:hypothetical protein BXY64_2971 [Marinifilum flexuosum]